MSLVLVASDNSGNSQGALNIPSGRYSVSDSCATYASFIGPFREGFCLIVESYKSCVSLISGLIYARGPAAIAWFVAFIIFNSLNGVTARWTRPYVGNKGLKTVGPCLTNSNAALAVINVAFLIRICTSALHACPYFVFRRLAKAMRPVLCAGEFGTKTSAAEGFPAKIAGKNTSFGATFALTEPMAFANISDDGPASRFATSEVFDVVVHWLGLSRENTIVQK